MLLRLFLVSVFTVELSPCGKKISKLFHLGVTSKQYTVVTMP